MKRFQILGVGCSECEALAQRTAAVAREMGLEFELQRVTDLDAILEFGPVMVPALVVDGELKSAGRLPSSAELRRLIG